MENTANVYIETQDDAFHMEGVAIPAEAYNDDEERPFDWLRLIENELCILEMEGRPWQFVLFYNEDGLGVSHRVVGSVTLNRK